MRGSARPKKAVVVVFPLGSKPQVPCFLCLVRLWLFTRLQCISCLEHSYASIYYYYLLSSRE